MPVNADRIAKLSALGLNEQQARAYLALVDVETATANDLARSSRVPRAKLYEVLESLSRKGLLEVIPDSPQRFRANPLTALYDTRLEELRTEESELKRTISELMLQLLPQGKEFTRESERDFLHFTRGRVAFVTGLKQLLQRTERSLVVFGDVLFLARLRVYEEFLPLFGAAAEKVSLRLLVPDNVVLAVEGRRVHTDEIGGWVRVLPTNGTDALVAVRDESETLEAHFIPNDLHPSRGSDRIVVNRDPEMARLWARMHETLWERSRAWGAAPP